MRKAFPVKTRKEDKQQAERGQQQVAKYEILIYLTVQKIISV